MEYITNKGLSFAWCCMFASNYVQLPPGINVNEVFSIVRSCYKYDMRNKGVKFYEL